MIGGKQRQLIYERESSHMLCFMGQSSDIDRYESIGGSLGHASILFAIFHLRFNARKHQHYQNRSRRNHFRKLEKQKREREREEMRQCLLVWRPPPLIRIVVCISSCSNVSGRSDQVDTRIAFMIRFGFLLGVYVYLFLFIGWLT